MDTLDRKSEINLISDLFLEYGDKYHMIEITTGLGDLSISDNVYYKVGYNNGDLGIIFFSSTKRINFLRNSNFFKIDIRKLCKRLSLYGYESKLVNKSEFIIILKIYKNEKGNNININRFNFWVH